jgi:hypothetical protein
MPRFSPAVQEHALAGVLLIPAGLVIAAVSIASLPADERLTFTVVALAAFAIFIAVLVSTVRRHILDRAAVAPAADPGTPVSSPGRLAALYGAVVGLGVAAYVALGIEGSAVGAILAAMGVGMLLRARHLRAWERQSGRVVLVGSMAGRRENFVTLPAPAPAAPPAPAPR